MICRRMNAFFASVRALRTLKRSIAGLCTVYHCSAVELYRMPIAELLDLIKILNEAQNGKND